MDSNPVHDFKLFMQYTCIPICMASSQLLHKITQRANYLSEPRTQLYFACKNKLLLD